MMPCGNIGLMTDELFRNGTTFITNEMIQVGSGFITIDDIKSYALERERKTTLSEIKSDPTALRYTVLGFSLVIALGISIGASLIKGEMGFDDSYVRMVTALIVAAIAALMYLFGPRKARFCLSVVDREIKILRYKSTDQQNVLNAFNALEKAIDQHYAKYPQAERPRMLKGTF
jgi:Family of unknown function (DUF6232)